MAPNRVSPLDEPPAASSSEEEVEASSEEVESGSGSGSDESESEAETSKPASAAQDKKPQPKKPESAAKPQSSSSGETETDSEESESDGETLAKTKLHVKPIASKPMEEVTPPPKATRPRSKPAASPAKAKSGTKRPVGGESDVKDSKKAKKGDEVEEDGVEEESKKSKLFQRLWSDEDEIIILKGLKDYATKKGVEPYSDMTAFHEFIKKSLKVEVSKTQLQDKIRRMRKKFENNVRKKTKPTKDHDSKTFELSKKVWGGGEDLAAGQVSVGSPVKAEQPKSNGKAKAKSNQKGNSKTLTSLKAELLSTPEPLKEAEKREAFRKPCASGSVSNEVVGFDKGFKELGLSETIVQKGLELIGELKCAELKDKWNKLHVAELEIFVKRTELMRDQADMILEALKSEH